RPAQEPSLIIEFVFPFFVLAAQLAPQLLTGLVTVVRTTATLHAPDDAARIAWEQEGLHTGVMAGGHLAATSGFVRARLEHDYRIPGKAILDLPDGLVPGDWRIPVPSSSLLPASARSGFLFSGGHAAP